MLTLTHPSLLLFPLYFFSLFASFSSLLLFPLSFFSLFTSTLVRSWWKKNTLRALRFQPLILKPAPESSKMIGCKRRDLSAPVFSQGNDTSLCSRPIFLNTVGSHYDYFQRPHRKTVRLSWVLLRCVV